VRKLLASLLVLSALSQTSLAAPPSPGMPSVESLAPAANAQGLNVIWYEVRLWGAIQYTWKVERGGEGRFRRVNHAEIVFPVTAEAFDRIHTAMSYQLLTSHPAENCQPVATDGPYGSVHWRIDGTDNQVDWTSGYSCSNTSFVYESIDNADRVVRALAGLPATEQ
jgi:hypothetical protein